MKIELCGQLRTRFGESFEIDAKSVAEAIEGLSRQIPDFPREMLLGVPGFSSEAALRAETDTSEVKLVPILHGGKGFFKIVVGAALIALSAINPVFGTLALSLGVPMILNGVIGLFTKSPSLSKSEDPPASNYFGLNQNTTAVGTPIPMAWGEIPLNGHWVSMQADSSNLVSGVFPTNPT